MKNTEKVRITTDKIRINIEDLNEGQKRIIQYVKDNGRITNKEVRELLHVKDSRALKVLKVLVENGILIKEGKLRGSYYKLNF